MKKLNFNNNTIFWIVVIVIIVIVAGLGLLVFRGVKEKVQNELDKAAESVTGEPATLTDKQAREIANEIDNNLNAGMLSNDKEEETVTLIKTNIVNKMDWLKVKSAYGVRDTDSPFKKMNLVDLLKSELSKAQLNDINLYFELQKIDEVII